MHESQKYYAKGNEAIQGKLHTILFHLYEFLEKTKLQQKKAGPWSRRELTTEGQ